MKTLPLDPQMLKTVFAVSNDSPTGIVWLNCPQKKIKTGTPAGRRNQEGYYHVQLCGLTYLVHRVIWALTQESDPGEMQVDHIDGVRTNNNPANLRLVTNRINNQNKTNHSKHGTGVKPLGVKYQARIRINGRLKHLGTFATREEASHAYAKAATALPLPSGEVEP